jgi:FMN phosphatase YigB (HAD superfamily)
VIRVVMFDLGMTLVDADLRPFPHVEDALTAIARFKTADGKDLRSCLVSDFIMANQPITAEKITALFKQYLAKLDRTGLRHFFEPVDKRVTLSTHAGAQKPARKIFEKALERLGTDVPLGECLFITEEATHIEEARKELKMATLQFRIAGSGRFDFDDWAQAPAMIANLVAPHQEPNAHIAIKTFLAAKGIDMLTAEPEEPSGRMRFSGRVWSPISVTESKYESLQDLQNVNVAFHVEGEITRGPKGEVRVVLPGRPSAEQVRETTDFVQKLADRGEIAGKAGKLGKRATRPTHQIETDEKGNRRLVRKGFTAV